MVTRKNTSITAAAGIYIMSVIGAGYASGQEIQAFFISSGVFGLGGILIATVLFCCYGKRSLSDGFSSADSDFDGALTRYFGHRMRLPLKCVIFAFSFSMLSVMMSCLNSINTSMFSLPVSVVLSCSACMLSLAVGKRFLDVAGYILSPIMVVILTAFCIYRISLHIDSVGYHQLFDNILPITELPLSFTLKALRYVGYNCISTLPVLIMCGRNMHSKAAGEKAGLIGGCVLSFLMLIIFITLSCEGLSEQSLPLLYAAGNSSQFWKILFTVALYCSVYTTAVSLLYSLTETVSAVNKDNKSRSFRVSGCILCIVCSALSLIGFRRLIDIIYPVFGFIGAAVLLLYFLRLPFRIK